MDSELSDACLEAILKATKPITLSEIGVACLRRSKPNTKLMEALKQLAGRAVIHQWPTYRRSQIFDRRPLRRAVEDAFLAALDNTPLTIAKAAGRISQALGRVSEKSVLAELRKVAPKLVTANKIIQVPVSRQSVVYISILYVGCFVPTKSADSSIEKLILDVVVRLEPGRGNYVSVDQLNRSAELRRFFDGAIIALADQGKLVLAPYGGPRPKTDEERSRYVEDATGQLFVGVAFPRDE
jgi:hypothetical protein